MPDERFRRPALIVGHPGHELRVLGWLSEHPAKVIVLTDGSGRHGVSRLDSTDRALASVGLVRDDSVQAVPDQAVYTALRDGDSAFFVGLATRLAKFLFRNDVDQVVGDASEGFNPTHDICRAIIDAAVGRVQLDRETSIGNFAFPLTEGLQARNEVHDERCNHFRLSDDQLAQKVKAAEDYPELREEVQMAVAVHGADYFRTECMRPVITSAPTVPAAKPFYETFGEKRVAEGHYDSVIRFSEHMYPVLTALDRFASAPQSRVTA